MISWGANMAVRPRGARRISGAERASKHEENRFAKKQQWAVTAAGVGIMYALYSGVGAANAVKKLETPECTAVIILIAAVPLACIYFLLSLQCHLARVRLDLDPNDETPFSRGLPILAIFAGLLVITAGLVLYALHRAL